MALRKIEEEESNTDHMGTLSEVFEGFREVIVYIGYQEAAGIIRVILPKMNDDNFFMERRNRKFTLDKIIAENYFGTQCTL